MTQKTKKSASAIIVAAGSGSRMGTYVNKQFLLIDEIPVLARTLKAFDKSDNIDNIIVVARQEDILLVNDLVREFDISKIKAIVPGGKTRQESVINGLDQIKNDGFVAVHDGARPFVSAKLIDKLVNDAFKYGASAPGVVPKDTVKVADNLDFVETTPNRETLRLIQTPQVFRTDELKLAYIRAKESGFEGTDDCSIVENMGIPVHLTSGEYTNIKVTTPEDLPIAEAICAYLEK